MTLTLNKGFWQPLDPSDPYWNDVVLLVTGEAPIGDISNSPCFIETVGDPTVSTSVKKVGDSSIHFDGSDALQFSEGKFNLGSGSDSGANFTLEFWVYPTTLSGSSGWQALFDFRENYGAHYLEVAFVNNQLTGYNALSNSYYGTFTNDTWQHICIERDDGTVRYYKDGSSFASFTQTGQVSGAGYTLTLAAYREQDDSPTGEFFTGYLDSMRLTKVARYKGSTFTPNTTPLPTDGGDADWSSVQAVTSFNGTPFVYVNPATTSGTLSGSTTSIDTSNTMFSSAGSYDSGASDYLYDAAQSIGLFGTGAWSVESWFYPTTTQPTESGVVVGCVDWHSSGSSSALEGWAIYLYQSNVYLQVRQGASATNWDLGAFSVDTWYYVAVGSSGTAGSGTATVCGYLSTSGATTASRSVSSTYTYTLPSSNPDLYQCWGVYKGGTGGYQNRMIGQLDSCRITKGVDRFQNATSITVPTSEFPTS